MFAIFCEQTDAIKSGGAGEDGYVGYVFEFYVVVSNNLNPYSSKTWR